MAERHAKWLELRKKGLTFRAIAADEGVSPNAVFEAVHGALKAIREEPAAELRQLELERLDALLRSVWDQAVGELGEKDGDTPEMLEARVSRHLDSLEAARKLLADRRKILGLDAPTKVEQTHELTTIELPELKALLNSMGYDIVPLKEPNGI